MKIEISPGSNVQLNSRKSLCNLITSENRLGLWKAETLASSISLRKKYLIMFTARTQL